MFPIPFFECCLSLIVRIQSVRYVILSHKLQTLSLSLFSIVFLAPLFDYCLQWQQILFCFANRQMSLSYPVQLQSCSCSISPAVQQCCEDFKGMSEEGFESVMNWVSVYGVWLPSLSLLICQCLNRIEGQLLDIFLIVTYGHFQNIGNVTGMQQAELRKHKMCCSFHFFGHKMFLIKYYAYKPL